MRLCHKREPRTDAAATVWLEPRHPARPIPRPCKVQCSGINSKGHAAENPNARLPSEPVFFAKLPSAVIGRRLRRAAEADVMRSIFGYMQLHDVSGRDVQMKDAQIMLGKNFDGFAPIGPCIGVLRNGIAGPA